MKRYILHIYFELSSKNIEEPFKTLKEAEKYIDLVDSTCRRAYIEDRVTNNIVIDIK